MPAAMPCKITEISHKETCRIPDSPKKNVHASLKAENPRESSGQAYSYASSNSKTDAKAEVDEEWSKLEKYRRGGRRKSETKTR